ncbi:MAG: GGDEF domain-containing protein [Lachnospiraceae bacterium]|nr:GGDEF domain-containing protein [Lachnospiraceae bacterium]
MNREKHAFLIVYFVMCASVISLLLISASKYGYPSNVKDARSRLLSYDKDWTDIYGNPVDLEHLNEIEGVVPGNSFSIYHIIPFELDEGDAITFRSKNVSVDAYIDEKCIYKYNVPEPALNSEAVGTNWNYIELPLSGAGKKIELRITTSYKSASAKIDYIYLGDSRESQLVTIYDKIAPVMSCIMFIFVGVLFILADIPLNSGSHKNHEFFYLGLFSLTIALWCLTSTYSIQIFTGDSRTNHIVSCFLLMLIPIPTMLYLYEAYGEKIHRTARIVATLSIIEFVVNLILQLTNVADVQLTLFLSHILLAMAGIVFFTTIFINSINKTSKNSVRLFKVIRSIGMGSIGVSAIIDIVRYTKGYDDASRYVRIGLLIFIICYGGSSLEKSIDTIRLGTKADIISKLAYQDGLTELGNRTLFKERLSYLDSIKVRDNLYITITMFDVNNLKKINDILGHQAGDEMLIESAEIIKRSFGSEGECFRTGGDEFVSIITGNDSEARAHACHTLFEGYIDDHNSSQKTKYLIKIASGSCTYKPKMGDKSLNEIYQTADDYMYANKKQMKLADGDNQIIITDYTGRTDRLQAE